MWFESVKYGLQKDRTMVNCFGRAVRFLGGWNDDLFKSAYSMLPQSTVVDSLNIGMQRLYDDSAVCGNLGANADILAQVHDSILMQIPITYMKDPKNFEWMIEKIRHETSPEMTYNGRTFTIASDFKFGMNWGGYDENKNPMGMQEFEDYESFMKALEKWENLDGAGTTGLVN